jgi:diguanylate cyclase (GGDEF)-like protein/PAS domain S-box-containing protein
MPTFNPTKLKYNKNLLVIWIIGALLFSIWCFVIAWSISEKRTIVSENYLNLSQLRNAVQSQTKNLFRQAESTLLVANHWIASHPNEDPAKNPDFIELVDQLSKASDGLLDIRMASTSGEVQFAPSLSLTNKVNVSDRDYFKAQFNSITRGFFISKPVLSRITDNWILTVSAPVEKTNSDVRVLFILIELKRIESIFEKERIKPFGAITITKLNGDLIFRNPFSEDIANKTLANNSLWPNILQHPDGGEFETSESIVDGQNRLISYGKVDDYPLIVFVSNSKDQMLLGWTRHTQILSLVACLISIFGIVMGLSLLRSLTFSQTAESIIKFSDEAIVLKSLTGQVISWNKGAERIFGYSEREMVGKSILQIVPAERMGEEKDILATINRGEGIDHLETVRVRKDGQHINVSVTTSPTWDSYGRLIGASKIARDITVQKQANDQLKLTASVFTNASEGIVIIDRHGTIIEANEAFTRITAFTREEMIGTNIKKNHLLIHDQVKLKSLRTSLSRQGVWKGELISHRKDDTSYSIWLTVTKVLSENGKVKSYLALFSDITILKLQQKKLERDAHFDSLTNLPNRLLLSDRLRQTMSMCRRNGSNLAVLYLDLDGFKDVNDTFGHKAGDELLISVSARMNSVMRAVDTLARIGGDEFVAVLADVGSPQDCLVSVKRLLSACSDPVTIHGKAIKVTASIGITMFPQDDVDADQLMRHADQAMYQAKQSGKNRFFIFDSLQDAEAKSRTANQDRIATGLSCNEFLLYYQPKVNMRTGEIIGVEALIRWNHPERGLLPPSAFLGYIEEHSLNESIGEWVINQALQQINTWKRSGLDINISVNISARQLQSENFTSRLAELLTLHGNVLPGQLELEVLETSALENISTTAQVLESCRKLGVHFAIDDFGTGYSSLTYLRHLPVETLKIDQTFVRDMLVDNNDLSIVKGVVGLAVAFDREVIAEGVETISHGIRLLELGCELAQGYQIARPMPAENIADWCMNWRSPKEWTNPFEDNGVEIPLRS